MGKLTRTFGLLEPLRMAARNGLPMYGTCAGMVLLANEVHEGGVDQPLIGGMDIDVTRNAFGSQVESFETDVTVPVLQGGPFHAVFIRAPSLRAVGPGVEVLARLADNTPVAARQGHMVVSSFHPELTPDSRMHELFLRLIAGESREVPQRLLPRLMRRGKPGPGRAREAERDMRTRAARRSRRFCAASPGGRRTRDSDAVAARRRARCHRVGVSSWRREILDCGRWSGRCRIRACSPPPIRAWVGAGPGSCRTRSSARGRGRNPSAGDTAILTGSRYS